MFIGQLSLGTLIITLTVIFHVIGLVYLSTLLTKSSSYLFDQSSSTVRTISLLSVAILFIIGLHTIEAWSWALIYLSLEEFTQLMQALYFSVVTSTTLGYGDIILSDRWQLLSTFEAMGGLILFGTSTACIIELMRKVFYESVR